MKKLKQIILWLGFIFILSLQLPLTSQANEVGFSVTPVLPSNQLDTTSGYFHLLTQPSDKNILSVNLKNSTDSEVVIKTSVRNATTNINGVVDYIESSNKLSGTAPMDLEKQVKIAKEVVISPKSEVDVPIEVQMPSQFFEGIVAGGISFEEVKAADKQKTNAQTSVKNNFSYVIALLLQEEEVISVQPELNLENVVATQINTKVAISGAIKNVASAYLNDMSIDVSIYKKDDKKAVYNYKKSNMQLAPNSIIDFPAYLNGEKLNSGEYDYVATVKGTTSTEIEGEADALEWELRKTFNVEGSEAKELNKQDTTIEQPKVSSLVYILVAINILLVLLIVGYIIYKKRKK